jgi:glycosyltransferase involved in cell wall biosynthesis
MKILLISTNADLAGAPLHVREVATALARDGHDPFVVFGSDGVVRDYLEAEGIRTRVVGGIRSALNFFHDVRAYRRLHRVIREEGPDIIHCHSAKAGMLGRLASLQLKIPCIYTVHGWGFGAGRKLINSVILRIVERVLRDATNHFVTVSEVDRITGINKLGIESSTITTIRNGIDFSVSSAMLRPLDARVIMVARNDFQKDYETLARALAESEVDSACFVGAGTDSLEFKSRINEIVDGKCRIDYLGIRKDVHRLLEASSIFVLSSRYEALPLSIIEAMSKGLPVVASDVGGNRELVTHGSNGFLFKPGNHLELGSYLNILKNDAVLRREMGRESINRYITEFSKDRMMRDLYSIYFRLLGMDQSR